MLGIDYVHIPARGHNQPGIWSWNIWNLCDHRYVQESPAHIPAGYATSYSNNFTFVTIRLAGHQVLG